MTNAARQAAYRARKAAAGTTEVRGIFAPPADHAAIKEAAKNAASYKLSRRCAAATRAALLGK